METTVISLFFLIYCLDVSHGVTELPQQSKITTITRLSGGDVFETDGAKCSLDNCVGLSSGTAISVSLEDIPDDKGPCTCQCHRHLPAFREDLHLCVDDIHECVLAPFVSGTTSQRIPFVFLPLKGQIIHPSKEINFTGVEKPICAVSGAKFLTDNGWSDLRNTHNADVPFRLFRDEDHTYLQWVGEADLRTRMVGRLILVHILCREVLQADQSITDSQSLFMPCVAFRVVGTPTKYLYNVSEVSFSTGAHASDNEHGENGLSVSEYLTIGLCSVMLGLIYVASVFLYLHFKKKKKQNNNLKERHDNHSLISAEEGVIKNNPLLDLGRTFSNIDNSFSDTSGSDTDLVPDSLQQHEDRKKSIQIMSALVHPSQAYFEVPMFSLKPTFESVMQDSSTIEKLPEENVSIIETLEGREDRSDTLKAINGNTRKKLYFNPAYFEPELLLAPPPAALEFLTKIREVICLAKQKMNCKKYVPTLLGIPEEDLHLEHSRKANSHRASIISLKRDNSRRRTCAGCPGCKPLDLKNLCGRLPEFSPLVACNTCTHSTNNSKQRSIEKWLENVPILKLNASSVMQYDVPVKPPLTPGPRRLRSPTRSLSPEYLSPPYIVTTPRPASERAYSSMVIKRPTKSRTRKHREVKKVLVKPKAPPPPIPTKQPSSHSQALPPPDMINEAIAVDSKEDVYDKSQVNVTVSNRKSDYESDSLERSGINGYSTPSEYADFSSSQPSPSLTSALPLAEEMTMRNAILNTKTGNMTISRLSSETKDNEDYELVAVSKPNLPELLQQNSEYNFVSEVYVNSDYNNDSNVSSPCHSACSTLDGSRPKIKYTQPNDKPGQLTIEVEDCPDNYIRVDESDDYEPDTLDRKPNKKLSLATVDENQFIDSLERPNHILLRTTGTFKNNPINLHDSNKSFGSLREVFEHKNRKINKSENVLDVESKKDKHPLVTWKNSSDLNDDEGRLLTLEERHWKRQRRSIEQPPDVIPPHNDAFVYEHPKPPRKITIVDDDVKPPLPPKNVTNRSISRSYGNVELLTSPTFKHNYSISLSSIPSTSVSPNSSDYETYTTGEVINNGNVRFNNLKGDRSAATQNSKKLHSKHSKAFYGLKKLQLDGNNNVSSNRSGKRVRRHKQIDSGYLSTDSSASNKKKRPDSEKTCTETDESFGDGHSESGAESIETHSVFFNSFRKPLNSMEIQSDSTTNNDLDNVSYTTVIPESTKYSVIVN